MLAYTKPQHRKKEESEQLRGERYEIKLIDQDLKDGKLRKAKRSLNGMFLG